MPRSSSSSSSSDAGGLPSYAAARAARRSHSAARRAGRSRVHMLVHCGMLWRGGTQDNLHVGAFVRCITARMAADPQRYGAFLVRRSGDPASAAGLFIDTAVYTRNRAFRLYQVRRHTRCACVRGVAGWAGLDACVHACVRVRWVRGWVGGWGGVTTARRARCVLLPHTRSRVSWQSGIEEAGEVR